MNARVSKSPEGMRNAKEYFVASLKKTVKSQLSHNFLYRFSFNLTEIYNVTIC